VTSQGLKVDVTVTVGSGVVVVVTGSSSKFSMMKRYEKPEYPLFVVGFHKA